MNDAVIMKPSRAFVTMERTWVGQNVSCYTRDLASKRIGPFNGTVTGISSNEAEAELQGRAEYHPTGLLVRIPDLGRHVCYGEWPVHFSDACITDPPMSAKIKTWSYGDGLGNTYHMAAVSQMKAFEAFRKAARENRVSFYEFRSRLLSWGNAMAGIEPVNGGVWLQTDFGRGPVKRVL